MMPKKKPEPSTLVEMSPSDTFAIAGREARMPIGIAAILAPLADLTHPILPEPVITDPEREAMTAALTALRDPESDPVEVPLPASCPDLAGVQALAAALRVTAGRMGLAVQFYPRAPRVGVTLALMARRSVP
jgi:hypothetical protein